MTIIYRMRYILFFLLLGGGLSGQKLLLLPSQLDSLVAVDSLNLLPEPEGLLQNLKVVGLVNNRYPATLISNDGLVLVPTEALEEYIQLPDSVAMMRYDDPLSLKNFFISFPVRSTEITSDILLYVKESMTLNEKFSIIQGNIRQKLTELGRPENGRYEVKRYLFQNRFFLHQYLDFREVQLLWATHSSDGKSYGIVKIFGESLSQLKAPMLSSQDDRSKGNYAINFPPKTYYQSSASALALHLSELDASMSILQPAIDLYQQFRRLPPESLASFYEQQYNEQTFLLENQAMEKRIRTENSLIMDSKILALQQNLQRESKAIEKLHQQYFRSQALNRTIKLISLVEFLERRAGLRSDQTDRLLAYLDDWQKDWNPTIDRALFETILPAYFNESRGQYFSTDLIDQIRATNKSFEEISQPIYEESLLSRPEEIRAILKKDGPEELFTKLEEDAGYYFFTLLLRDQQEKIFRPYRKNMTNWSGQENNWLQKTAKQAGSRIDGNGSQRIHFAFDNQLESIPLWKDNAGSPFFDKKNELMGFLFPEGEYPAGIDWYLPTEVNPSQMVSISEILQLLSIPKR